VGERQKIKGRQYARAVAAHRAALRKIVAARDDSDRY